MMKLFLLTISFISLLFSTIGDIHSQELQNYTCYVDRIDIKGMEASREFDKDGIIKSAKRYHPLSIIQFGILAYYKFKETNDSIYYKKCVNQIKYFKDPTKVNTLYDGKGLGLPYTFKFWDLKAPWYSGMTQGYAISYLLRYHELTNDPDVYPLIEKIAHVLLQRQENGGTLSTTNEGYTWIEEYPNSKKSPQVLNGYINGLIGLKEYTDFFPSDTTAKRILDETYLGLVNSLEYYDTPTWSYYNRARKPLKNNYLRYQVYEMQHLYEIFNDEIFDNQKRIWSVLSKGKYVRSKSKAYKYPKHDMSIPITEVYPGYYGIPINKRSYMGNFVSLQHLKHKSLWRLNRFFRKNKHKEVKDGSTKFYITFNEKNYTNYLEFSIDTTIHKPEIILYKRDENNRIKKMDAVINIQSGNILFSFEEIRISNIILLLKNTNSSIITPIKFYNTNTVKPPFYGHLKTKAFTLNSDKKYNIDLKLFNTDKVVIFYKYAKKETQLKSSKWKAKNTADSLFLPQKTGVYKFMVVYDYTSPLSMIGAFSIDVEQE